MNAIEKRESLAKKIKAGEFILAAGIYDMISAKIADHARQFVIFAEECVDCDSTLL